MIDLLIAGVLAVLAALGGIFIKDLKAFAIFTTLTAIAASLLYILTDSPTVILGLMGLFTAVVRIPREMRVKISRIKIYRSRERLRALDELVKKPPQEIIDIIPAGSRRAIHPSLLQLIGLVTQAYSKGYAVEEPAWFTQLRQYLVYTGPDFSPEKPKIVSIYEIVDLDV